MGFEAQSEATPLTPEQEEQLKAVALARAPKDLEAADSAKTDEELFYALPSVAMGAYLLGKHDRAKALAERALALALSFQRNWNYGNALHFSHSVLGLLALDNGDVSGAVDELKKAGATPGSPQLDSFGPTMWRIGSGTGLLSAVPLFLEDGWCLARAVGGQSAQG